MSTVEAFQVLKHLPVQGQFNSGGFLEVSTEAPLSALAPGRWQLLAELFQGESRTASAPPVPLEILPADAQPPWHLRFAHEPLG